MKRKVLFFLCLLTNSYLNAQNQTSPSSYGQWLMYFGDNKISKSWGLHSEIQLRNYLLPNATHQTLIRPGVNFYAGPNVMLTAGYAYIDTRPGREIIGNTTIENRIWEQLILRQKFKYASFEHRYRLEQRFINNQTHNTSRFAQRIRYRFLVSIPINNFIPKLHRLFVSTYNEFFINVGKDQARWDIDRNRAYFAFGYKYNEKMNFQIGYLNQVINIPGDNQAEINHNLQVGIFYNLRIAKLITPAGEEIR